ncbi:unnamed protein product [Phytophthora fragariaefolia]|uniref:Unnamed protein product n=1 Tax=Phytophthora fragariaefolia TaxID=1490495 RepID=A0A9W6XTQ7_9STRA|nr:unnamed protein product [Phytophthora fragariaefolia]
MDDPSVRNMTTRGRTEGCLPVRGGVLAKGDDVPATLAESGSHAKKSTPTKPQAPATTTASSAKSTRRARASKRTEVRLPGSYVEPAHSESDTDTANPDLITGDEDSTAGSPAPRATKPSKGESASANTTASEPTPVEEAAIPSPDVSSDPAKRKTS